jgi:hypothetical protein
LRPLFAHQIAKQIDFQIFKFIYYCLIASLVVIKTKNRCLRIIELDFDWSAIIANIFRHFYFYFQQRLLLAGRLDE